ncbi:MAG TPA: Rieske (2Fe-2S) protein [Gemmatimonadaceae bacterium]|nr:Rieske (2Fe-2S) protein [Gemmatimonadaceae bacterium]
MRTHPNPASSPADDTAAGDACGGCPLTVDRRRFLRGAALAVVASLAAAGAAPAAALAESLGTTRARRALGSARAYPVPASDGVSIDAGNEVILARWQNRVYAFSLRCPHRGTRLKWRPDEGHVFCPKHKARFSPDGAHASGRRTRPLDRHALARRGGTILVDTATLYRADQDPDGWAAAVLVLA